MDGYGMKRNRTTALSASVEDYLEAIVNLSRNGARTARGSDIAARLGVSKASVTGALRLLKRKGLAVYEPYGAVTLTALGTKLGTQVSQRHRVLTTFFEQVLGVDGERAQQTACRVEHVLDPKILWRMTRFVEFVVHSRSRGMDVAGDFQRFCASRRRAQDAQRKAYA